MNRPPAFSEDVSGLPDHAFSYRSLTWWGVIDFMIIEGLFFALMIAAYFFLMSHEQHWAPEPIDPPGLVAGSLFTLVMLLSEIPNTMVKRAATEMDIVKVRRLLLLMSAIGGALLVIRGFEFNSLHVLWYSNAYGSVLWGLLVLHTTHVATDLGDTIVLAFLMRTAHGETPRRFIDTDENALYWRFVWISWLPIYALIYWVPRLFR
ncbi:cytochrome c oxidase subunit 3 [Sphingomonas sp. URHD0057]|uniref:cytochrome c oxidase subunit 3 n=1 Tax=Sphingomonas sp. URHD0057 TaxID=1380389 RepID=UPI00048C66E8|nr:cytochrome c oxidase subunit 3 [Sphingomonas sp. URHD0057]